MKQKETITISWSVQDVLHQAKKDNITLTNNQALDVLNLLVKNHDASVGINWGVISDTITIYLSK